MSERDGTGFRCVLMPELWEGGKMWASDDNHRVVVKRAPNRFQGYQWIEDDSRHYSVGYLCTRDDIRLFLGGRAVTMISEFGEDTNAEPLTFDHPTLVTF